MKIADCPGNFNPTLQQQHDDVIARTSGKHHTCLIHVVSHRSHGWSLTEQHTCTCTCIHCIMYMYTLYVKEVYTDTWFSIHVLYIVYQIKIWHKCQFNWIFMDVMFSFQFGEYFHGTTIASLLLTNLTIVRLTTWKYDEVCCSMDAEIWYQISFCFVV